MLNFDVFAKKELLNFIQLLISLDTEGIDIARSIILIKNHIDKYEEKLNYNDSHIKQNIKKHICKYHGEMTFCSVNKIWYCKKCYYSEMP